MNAARLAGRGPAPAERWLRTQPGVSGVTRGSDRVTLDIMFRDGGRLLILPPSPQPRRPLRPVSLTAQVDAPAPSSGRALVLEPFADELNLGPSAGQSEAAALSQAGFAVTILRNDAVSVDAMETLSSYSVVYMLTHSGTLPNGDAVVVTGEVSPARPQQSPLASLYSDHSLLQATVAGQSRPQLYNAITSTFVREHLGSFPPSSFIFLNGCQVLGAPILWQAFQAKGVRAMAGWDNDANSNVDIPAGNLVLARMAAGETLAGAIASAQSAGLGVSTVAGQTAHLGLIGDGNETLAQSLNGQVPTPTATPLPPTAVPTATPVATSAPRPTATPAKKRHKRAPTHVRKHRSRPARCRPGHHRSHGRCVPTKRKHHKCAKHCRYL